MSVKLGMKAKLYVAESAAAGITAFTEELANVRDVTLNLSADEADVTTRENDGWHQTLPTLKNCDVTFEMPNDTTKPGYKKIREAWLNNKTVGLCVLSGAKDDAEAEGVIADFGITDFSRGEPLADAQSISVTAKIYKFKEWYIAPGGTTP